MKTFLLSLLLVGACVSGLAAQERHALVIGNSAYTQGPLENPTRDADAMEVALTKANFRVTKAKDLTRAGMNSAIRKFQSRLTPECVALVFYAGHGVQVDGENYLIPVKADIRKAFEVADEAVSLSRVLGALKRSHTRLNIVILDCCRDNPYERSWRSAGGGLANVRAPEGTFIAYATAPNTTAADGAGGNSPYTAALTQHLTKRGWGLYQIFNGVAKSVYEMTEGQQRPWKADDLLSDFYFVPGTGKPGDNDRVESRPRDPSGSRAGQPRTFGGIPMRWCPPGSFTMGSPTGEAGRYDDEAQMDVELAQGFWLGETEVTQSQWQTVMGTTVTAQLRRLLGDDAKITLDGQTQSMREHYRSWFGDDHERIMASYASGHDYPMIFVSWEEARQYGERLTARLQRDGIIPQGWVMALPTEAQWEYACRAATSTATFAGPMVIEGQSNAPILDTIAWYGGNSSDGYPVGKGIEADWPEKEYPGGWAGRRVVGGKRANSWGFRDMIGNVSEWCADWFRDSLKGGRDPVGPAQGAFRAHRGGSWSHDARDCRAATRNSEVPSVRLDDLGFRVVLRPVR